MGRSRARRRVRVAIALATAFTLSACTAATPSGERVVAAGLTGQSLCKIASKPLAEDALPGVSLGSGAPEDQGSFQSCTLSATDNSSQLVKITVNYGNFSFSNAASINKSLSDGSTNAKEQCPRGSSLPKVTEGLPSETTLICTKADRSIVEYTGKSNDGAFVVRVERAGQKGAIVSADAQRWVDAVAAGVLAIPGPRTPASAASLANTSLTAIANNWNAAPTPPGWRTVGPQPKIRSISSIYSVFSTIAGDPCREITSGLLILPSDQKGNSEIAILAALGSSAGGSQTPAQLAASARVFGSHQEALNWTTKLNAVAEQCATSAAAGASFFSTNGSGLIRWSGSAVRDQPSSGFVEVIGNAVFAGSADADAGILDQPGLDAWVSAVERNAQASLK